VKTIFVGHFAPSCHAMDEASSAAGNQVQRQIIKELEFKCGAANVASYSMAPSPAWPHGPLVSRSLVEGSVAYIGYINLPVIKHIEFAVRLLIAILRSRPQLCLQYNSYLFENIALVLVRLFLSKIALCICIQDIHVSPQVSIFSKRGLRSFSERASLWVARRFNIIVPISDSIIDDFHLDRSKCFVFQGGITDYAEKLMKQSELIPLQDIAVFAGALEPHNGIDLLVDQWITSKIEWPLHVFGRGSLHEHVSLAAEHTGKIVFHGFQPEHVVFKWQCKARWNFCLRYSLGLNERYFFPSKFFNIVCASGAVLTNDFHGIPVSLREHIIVISEDLSDLSDRLTETFELADQNMVVMRHEIVVDEFSWGTCIGKILEMKNER